MGKYTIHIVRHFRHEGEIEVEAESEYEAQDLAFEQIDDVELELSDLVEGQDMLSVLVMPDPVPLDPVQQTEVTSCLASALADLKQLQDAGVLNGVMEARIKRYEAMVAIINEKGL